MAAYAGFYTTPEAWTVWVRSHPKCPTWTWGAAAAEDLIEKALWEKKLEKYFHVEVVPVPPSEPDYQEEATGIMLVRRMDLRRAYIPQRLDSKYDLAGRQMIKKLIGLEVSVWKTMWYNDLACDAPYEAKFLKPRTRMKGGKAKNKTGNGTKKSKFKTKITSEASSKEEGDHDGKERVVERYNDQSVQVGGGKVEDNVNKS